MNQQYEEILNNEPKLEKSSKIMIIVVAIIILVSMLTTKLPEPQSKSSLDVASDVIHGLLDRKSVV